MTEDEKRAQDFYWRHKQQERELSALWKERYYYSELFRISPREALAYLDRLFTARRVVLETRERAWSLYGIDISEIWER